MDVPLWQIISVFFVSGVASVLSGMAGGGGGFIMAPFFIWIGLTPQETIATGKVSSLGLVIGAITAFRGKVKYHKKLLWTLLPISALIGVVSTYIFTNLDNSILQKMIGVLMILLVPAVLMSGQGVKARAVSKNMQTVGFMLFCLVIFLQGILGGGVGAMVSVIMIVFMGVTALEANLLKRLTSLMLNGVIVLLVIKSGLIQYPLAFAGLAGAIVGSHAGSLFAIKKGNKFAIYALVAFMLISGVVLLVTA